MRQVSLLVVTLLLLWNVAPVHAQRTTGEISGRVLDESGASLPGVEVMISGAGIPGTPIVITTESGSYRFPVLPAGEYEVTYVLLGFTTAKYQVRVTVGQTLDMNVTMKVNALQETIM